jgi:hypothetical protein
MGLVVWSVAWSNGWSGMPRAPELKGALLRDPVLLGLSGLFPVSLWVTHKACGPLFGLAQWLVTDLRKALRAALLRDPVLLGPLTVSRIRSLLVANQLILLCHFCLCWSISCL